MRKLQKPIALLLVACMLFGLMAVGVSAVEISQKPANGNTVGQPFAPYTGGSQNFRIPGIVTLDNGTLIAACDARWNHSGDGAGLDTIVSVSTDNGANWTYTYANYLGDNGDTYNNLSTCFIDPGIGTDGTTAYLIADLWPAGIALNTSKYSPVSGKTGFDDNDNLQLRDVALDTVAIGGSGYNTMAARATYGYYLDLDTLEIYAYGAEGEEDTLVEGYTVDAYFNIKGEGVDTNLFFSDSPYQPYPTDYLYMTTSTDGLNWSEPTLLNLKEASEQTLLVGPGNGTYSEVYDHMIFTAYEHSSGYERASLIWMDTEGNWTRSEDATIDSWSSEATSVVLDDGTVRMFYRDGSTALRYTDYVWSEAEGNYVRAATEVNTTAIVDSGCQLTAIKYSQQIDGKDVILVAGPTSSRRINGYIYTFLVNEDNSMELAYAYNITPDFYAYSCLTEMANGDIALLWESNGSALTFSTYKMADLTARRQDVRLSFNEMELLTGDTKTVVDKTGYYPDADLSELDTDVATVELSGSEAITDAAQLGSNANYAGDIIDTGDCVYTFAYDEETGRWSASSTDASGNPVYLYPGNTTGSGYPNRTAEYANLSIFEGYEEGTFCIMSNDCDNANQSTSYLYFDRSALKWDRVSAPGSNALWQTNVSLMLYRPVEGAGSAELPGYERVTNIADLTDGEYLVVGPGSNGNLYALYPNAATTDRYCQIAKILGRTVVGETRLVFTAIGPGYTEVQVGSTVYMITVADMDEVAVTVPVGQSVTVAEGNGNYADADTSALDPSIATVTLKGTDAANDMGVIPTAVTALEDGTYVIRNTRAKKLVNNTSASAEAGEGDMGGLRLTGSVTNMDAETAVWTITSVNGGYTIQDVNGRYMAIAASAAGLVDEESVIAVEYKNGSWTLCQNNAYLNDAGGLGTTASGWQNAAAATDAGSQFDIYQYSADGGNAATEVTFTGVYPGTTSVIIGRTEYTVTVTGDLVDVTIEPEETENYVVPGTLEDADLSKLDESVATVELTETVVGCIGTGSDYTGGMRTLEELQYTFTATADGYFEVSGVTADGSVVYLNHYSTTTSQIPNCATPGKIDVRTSSYDNMFKLVAKSLDGAGADRGLHFHTEKAFPHWNRCGNDTSIKCHEYLYRPVQENETSSTELPGYVLVSDLSEIVDGGKYLIAHRDEAGALYLLNPSEKMDSWFAHVAKVDTAVNVTVTGVAEGETSARVGTTIFEIAVGHQHAYEAVVTEPTCTEAGYTTYTCSVCGDTYVADEVDALGHSYEAVVTAPTCTDYGYTLYTCTVCGDSYRGDFVDFLDHSYETVVTAPTCTEAGYTTYTCSVCGDTYVADEVDALGHSYEAVVTAPTCTEAGYTTYTCSACGDTYVADEVDALGHNYENGICTGCGEADPDAIAAPVVTASNNASTGKVRLTWEAVEGAVKYEVYRATTKDGEYKKMYTTEGTSYTNTKANAGQYYYYYVVAINEAGKASAPSAIVGRTCDLARPVVTATNVAKTGKVRLTWEAVEGAVEYKVYRAAEKDGTYKLMFTTEGTSYTNTNAVAGTTYYYKVVAVAKKTAANSAPAEVSRTCDLPQVKVTGKLNLAGTPKLSWDKVEGAVSYKVYRATSADGEYKLMKTTTGTSYSNTNHVNGTTYYYYVVAVAENVWGNSAPSNVVKLTAK